MKQVVRIVLFLVIVLLVLEVIKTIVVKTGATASFFIGYVIGSLQMLTILGFIFVPFLFSWCKKRMDHAWKARRLSVLVFILAIGCLEWFCTMLLHNPARLPSFMKDAYTLYVDVYARSIIQFESKASVYDPTLFYTLRPNARFMFSNPEFNNQFTINRLGLRDDDSSLDKPAIVCLGDSYAMGWGVDQDSTFSQQLEKSSGKKVLNAAISSYGTAREIMNAGRIDTSALTYLVVQYCDNDFVENTRYLENKNVLKISSQQDYNAAVKSEAISKCYYPGKNFLTIAQIFIKQSVNKVVPVFSLTKNEEAPDATDSSQARSFLEVFSHAPVNFSTVKTIVLFPDKDTASSKAFERITDSLLQVSPYRERFGGHVRMLKVSTLLQPNDYYILDPHLKSSGHRKIAQALWKMMQTF